MQKKIINAIGTVIALIIIIFICAVIVILMSKTLLWMVNA